MTLQEQIKGMVREASKLMLNDSFEITQKDGYANIVTSSDTAVQEFLCQQFRKLIPDSGFLCEEQDIYDVQHEWTWIIDPIDGTANYSRGIDQCCICVGLKHQKDMQIGVVYLPRTKEFFYAEKGKGAFLNDRPIHVSQRPYADGILCTGLSVYHKEYTQKCAAVINETFLQVNDVRRFGSCATELCYLAMGRVELYFECALSPWDFAAASLILQEAGGCITDLEGNSLSCLVPTGVVAANNPDCHQRLLANVKKQLF